MRLPLLVIFISAHLFCYAQNQTTDTSATFVTYWKKGDEKKYHVTKVVEKFMDGQPRTSASSSYDVVLNVVDSTEEGFRIEWTYRNLKTEGEDALSNALAKLNEGLKIKYSIDEMGTFGNVTNLKEIQDYIAASFKVIRNSSKNDPGVESVLQELEKVFQNKVAIENIVIKDIQLFHSAYGAEYYTTQKLEAEVELPNALGGAPFPASLTFQLGKLAPEADYAQMVMKQEIDKVKGMEAIKEFLLKLVASGGAKLEGSDLPSQLQISDTSEFDIILSTGWLSKVHHRRLAKTGGYNKIDTLTFQQSKL